MRDDLARCAYVLRQQFVRERHHLHGTILSVLAQALGKPDQRARQTPGDIVHREALDPVAKLHRTLHQDLQQRDGQTRAAGHDIFDFRRGPGHDLGVLERERLLVPGRRAEERGFPEELVSLVDVDHHLAPIVRHPADFDFTVDHEINAGRWLILVVNNLALPVLQNARAGKMRQRIF